MESIGRLQDLPVFMIQTDFRQYGVYNNDNQPLYTGPKDEAEAFLMDCLTPEERDLYKDEMAVQEILYWEQRIY